MYRGPIEEGKDRQHVVVDPDVVGVTSTMWINSNIPTWYSLTGTMMVPPATVIPEEPDNG
jgi:hypothetical protein